MNTRHATEADHDAVWEIFHEVVAKGDAPVPSKRRGRLDPW